MATGNPVGYSWSFGNNTFSNDPNPSVTYMAGTYTVTLVAIFANYTVQSSQTVTIHPAITVNLTADRYYICTPGVINLIASPGPGGTIATYTFDFGDGTAPITTASNTISHSYASFGVFSATVTATSPFGCTATVSYNLTVQKPAITGTISPTSGCVPVTATLNAAVNVPVGGLVTNYSWKFGDGITVSGSSASISHTYIGPGNYTPSLDITTNEGCTNSFTFEKVGYGIPPTNIKAAVVKPVICGSETAMFNATATDANMYLWDYGDNTTDSISSTQAQHKYSTIGIKNVKVTAYYNGCRGTSQNLSIKIIGVIADFSYQNTCGNKNTYSFTNTTSGVPTSYNWSFGDGSPDLTTPNVIHTYPVSGIFPVKLRVTDSITGCADEKGVNIYTAQPTLLNPDSALCRNDSTKFTIINNYGNPANIYTWKVLNFSNYPGDNPLTVPAKVYGLYPQNYVVINYSAGSCPDTIQLNHPLLVRGPVLDFDFNTPVCAFTNVNIKNNSKGFIATDNIKISSWNYGNSSNNDTTYLPRPYSYSGAGLYIIKLVGIDINGCRDSLVKTIEVYPVPYLHVVPQRDTLCEGQQRLLVAFKVDPVTWSNGSTLSCATCDSTIAKPVITTNYVAKVTNSLGCSSTDTSRILVFNPFMAKVTLPNLLVCDQDSVLLSATPPGKIIRWSPAQSISDTTIYNPVVFPRSTTKYTAFLIDSAGCYSSTVSVNVVIKTLPTVKAGPDLILPFASSFQLSPVYTGTISNFLWTPGTNLNCTTCSSPTVKALKTVEYIIQVTSDSSCIARDTIKIIVECKDANIYLPTAFTPNGDGRNDYFYPLTRGVSIITRFAVFDRYGNAVFTRANFSPNIQSLGWDGKVKGLPQDNSTYVYLLESICDQGQTLLKKGSVVLIR